jgi:hypothetical protein
MTKQEAWDYLEDYVKIFSSRSPQGALVGAREALDTLKPPPDDDLPGCDLRAAWLKIVEMEKQITNLQQLCEYLQDQLATHRALGDHHSHPHQVIPQGLDHPKSSPPKFQTKKFRIPNTPQSKSPIQGRMSDGYAPHDIGGWTDTIPFPYRNRAGLVLDR